MSARDGRRWPRLRRAFHIAPTPKDVRGDADHIGAELEAIDGAVVRTRRRVETFDAMRREVGHTIRGLNRNRSFSLITIATLGIGIGATTAIFTLLDAVVLRPL